MKKPSISLIMFTVFTSLIPREVFAEDIFKYVPKSLDSGQDLNQFIKNIINILLFVAGIASVIVIIVGGIMYVVSGGNPDQTKKAKDAILYAIVGLVISILAFSIVSFITGPQGLGG